MLSDFRFLKSRFICVEPGNSREQFGDFYGMNKKEIQSPKLTARFLISITAFLLLMFAILAFCVACVLTKTVGCPEFELIDSAQIPGMSPCAEKCPVVMTTQLKYDVAGPLQAGHGLGKRQHERGPALGSGRVRAQVLPRVARACPA
jgi:hypothetical protein